MSRNLISYSTILAAKAGDSEAMTEIVKHYRAYIAHFSKRSFRDDFGNQYECVDEDIRERIESKLMLQIYERFDPYQEP